MNTSDMILDRILQQKREEVKRARERQSLSEIDQLVKKKPRKIYSLEAAVRAKALPHDGANGGSLALIAEAKAASPSVGVIRSDFDPVALAQLYAQEGAVAVSVLTDEVFFKGSNDHLRAVREQVSIPLLRKDFIIDPYQVYETRLLGADVLLLIVAALEPGQMRELYDVARSLELEVLVEVHNERELDIAYSNLEQITFLGINNRNLKTFEVDLSTTERLAARVSPASLIIAESGIRSVADVQYIAGTGAHALLVGEALLRATDISARVHEFAHQMRNPHAALRT